MNEPYSVQYLHFQYLHCRSTFCSDHFQWLIHGKFWMTIGLCSSYVMRFVSLSSDEYNIFKTWDSCLAQKLHFYHSMIQQYDRRPKTIRDIYLKMGNLAATMSKQYCRMLQVERLFRQIRMLLRLSRTLFRHCCRFSKNVERVFREISSFRQSRNKLNILNWFRLKSFALWHSTVLLRHYCWGGRSLREFKESVAITWHNTTMAHRGVLKTTYYMSSVTLHGGP